MRQRGENRKIEIEKGTKNVLLERYSQDTLTSNSFIWDVFVRDNKSILLPPPSSSQALQKGNLEGARIHAENAIRQKNQVIA